MPVKVFLAVKTKPGKSKEVQKSVRAIDEVTLACSVASANHSKNSSERNEENNGEK